MKNYSNFINGFISKYEIKDGKLTIMLYKTDGGECSWV